MNDPYYLPILNRTQIRALDSLVHLRWGLSIFGLAHSSPENHSKLDLAQLIVEISHVYDDLKETMAVWEWVLISKDIQECPCVMSEETYGDLMELIEAPLPDPASPLFPPALKVPMSNLIAVLPGVHEAMRKAKKADRSDLEGQATTAVVFGQRDKGDLPN